MKKNGILAFGIFLLAGCESNHPLLYNATAHPIGVEVSTANVESYQTTIPPSSCFGMFGIMTPSITRLIVTDYRGVRHQYSDVDLSNLRSSQTNGEILAFNNDGLHPLSPGMTSDPSSQLSSCEQ